MEGNLTPIGIVMCVVLCVSIVSGVGKFDQQENGSLLGWNPSNAYNTLISSSTNLSPNVISSQQSSSEYSGILVPMTSTPNRMRSRTISALPRAPKFDAAVASSYSCSPLYTTSSASYHSFDGGNSQYQTTSNVNRTASYHSFGGGNSQYQTTSNVNHTASTNIGAIAHANYSALAISSLQVYPSTNAGFSSATSLGTSRPKKAPGIGELDWGAWLEGFDGNTDAGWLYNGGDYMYFDIVALKNYFDSLQDENGNVLIGGVMYTWEDFLAWFFKNGENGDDGYGDDNDWWRVPMPDGVGVLLLFAVINLLLIYLRSRSKNTVTQTIL